VRLPAIALATALSASQERADILLEGGRILDGSGNPGRRADVAISGDRIRFVGDARAGRVTARETVDVTGLLVTPGFWDVHSHADLESRDGKRALPLLYQGVTTVILGIDGLGTNEIDSIFEGYEKAGIAVNALRYVGHGAARAAVMGGSFDRPASPEEIEVMKAYVEDGMEQGALGLSTGLAYNPGFYATTDEVVQLNEVAGRFGGIYDTHDRDMGATYQGIGYLASVREAIEIAERGSTPLIFSHLGALGVKAHALLPEALAIIETARARGLDVMAAQHVYTASASSFVAHCLPRWVAAGGSESLRRRLADPADWSRLEREIPEVLAMRGGPEKIVITDGPREWSGRSLAELAREWNLSPAGAVRRVVIEGGESIGDMNVDIYDMADIRLLAAMEWMMTCTDGIPPASENSYTHPRFYGAFTRKLRQLAIDERVITLPFAVRGMTALPAAFFGIPERGRLEPGFHADLAVFDESEIRDRATYEEPRRFSEGTVHVLVNGRFALRDGKPTGSLAGRPLRRTGRPGGVRIH
jgi:N-acyl-D-amino-acid deacylase